MLGFDLEYIINPLVNFYVGVDKVLLEHTSWDTADFRRLLYEDMLWRQMSDPGIYAHAGLTLKY